MTYEPGYSFSTTEGFPESCGQVPRLAPHGDDWLMGYGSAASSQIMPTSWSSHIESVNTIDRAIASPMPLTLPLALNTSSRSLKFVICAAHMSSLMAVY